MARCGESRDKSERCCWKYIKNLNTPAQERLFVRAQLCWAVWWWGWSGSNPLFRVVGHCPRLPRAAVVAPSLEVSKARLDGVWSNLESCPTQWQGVGILRSLPQPFWEHQVGEEVTQSNVPSGKSWSGAVAVLDGEILLLSLVSLMQGWEFVRGLWESGTWIQWQLRGI